MKNKYGIFTLSGKTALVTGATGHLGSVFALILAEAGANVLVNSRSHERCNHLVEEIRSKGFNATHAVFDVTSEEDIKKFALRMSEQPLHIIVNNAYAGIPGNFQNSDAQHYADSYETTVSSAHMILKNLLPNLRQAVKEHQDASVINIASMYGIVSPDQRIYGSSFDANPPFYGAAKAALIQWSRYIGCELGVEGIRVNAISPGPFPAEYVKKSAPEFIEKLSYKVPLNRVGSPSELEGPLLFLASKASSYVTGSNLVVDGGWTSW